MKLKDLNKGQRMLIKAAKLAMVPKRLNEQIKKVGKGKINPLLNKDGTPLSITRADSTYDGPEDRMIIIKFNPDVPFSRVFAFFVDKFGTFGMIYFYCLYVFDNYPKKKAEAKFRYCLSRRSKERKWIRASEMKKNKTVEAYLKKLNM